MDFQHYFLKLAQYNQWANQKLYHALMQLSDAQLNRPQAAFFPSILKTANHHWVGDTIWLGRMQGEQTTAYQLDSVVFQGIKDLTLARQKLDLAWIAFVENKTEQDILGQVTYSRWGNLLTENVYDVLTHVFNHQTHHRGQIHSMFYAETGHSLALDMIFFQRQFSKN